MPAGNAVFIHVAVLASAHQGSIRSFALGRDRCEPVATASAELPVALAVHPKLSVIYVANGCDTWEHRPRATVEAFFFDNQSGQLRSMTRCALSLSATGPRSIEVSPGGDYLLVAAFDGGAWNAFALDAEGYPAAHPVAFKEAGRGPWPHEQDTAHPSALLAHPQEPLLLASDYGTDRLSLLRAGTDGFSVEHRYQLPPGSGPTHLGFRSDWLVVSTALQPSLQTFRVRGGLHPGLVPLASTGVDRRQTALAVHSNADVVYTADAAGFTAWHVEHETGGLHRLGVGRLHATAVSAVALHGNSGLWFATPEGLLRTALDPVTGDPHETSRIVPLAGARALRVQEL
jgi:Lactonase, 7-bladed beta-propeller